MMRKNYYVLILAFMAALLAGCENDISGILDNLGVVLPVKNVQTRILENGELFVSWELENDKSRERILVRITDGKGNVYEFPVAKDKTEYSVPMEGTLDSGEKYSFRNDEKYHVTVLTYGDTALQVASQTVAEPLDFPDAPDPETPSDVYNLQQSAESTTSVTVTWEVSAAAAPTVTSFTLRYGSASGLASAAAGAYSEKTVADPTATSAQIDSLVAGTVNYVMIIANTSSTSLNGPEIKTHTVPEAPQNVAATKSAADLLSVAWDAPAANPAITHYLVRWGTVQDDVSANPLAADVGEIKVAAQTGQSSYTQEAGASDSTLPLTDGNSYYVAVISLIDPDAAAADDEIFSAAESASAAVLITSGPSASDVYNLQQSAESTTSVTVTWEVSAAAAPAITSFTLRYGSASGLASAAAGAYSEKTVADPGARTEQIDSLVAGTVNYVMIIANTSSTSLNGPEIKTHTVPEAPQNVAATKSAADLLSVAWDAPAANPAITHYLVRWGTVQDDVSANPLAADVGEIKVAAQTGQSSYTQEAGASDSTLPLTDGNSYYVAVISLIDPDAAAADDEIFSAAESASAAVLITSGLSASDVYNLQQSAESTTSVTVTWEVSAAAAPTITSFTLRYGSASGLASAAAGAYSEKTVADPGATSAQIDSLVAGTVNYVMIIANTSSTSLNGPEIKTHTVPEAPQNVAATKSAADLLSVAWDAPAANPAITHYLVRWGTVQDDVSANPLAADVGEIKVAAQTGQSSYTQEAGASDSTLPLTDGNSYYVAVISLIDPDAAAADDEIFSAAELASAAVLITSGPSALGTTSTRNLGTEDIDLFKIGSDTAGNTIGFIQIGNDVYAWNIPPDASATYDMEGSNYNYIQDLGSVAGNSVTVRMLAAHPVSKQLYILASNNRLYRVIPAQAPDNWDLEAVPLDAVDVAKISLPATMKNAAIEDFTWGKEDNTLFISASSGTFGLEAIIAWLPGPLNDDTEVDTAQQARQTLFTFGSPPRDDQGSYDTSAPIETLSYAYINDEGFISGINTCSPGFSLPVSELTSATTDLSLVQVFNMMTGTPGVMFHHRDSTAVYLFATYPDHYDKGQLVFILERIGESFLDGTYNTDADKTGRDATTLDPMVPNMPNAGDTNDETIYKRYDTASNAAPYGIEKLIIIRGGSLEVINM